MTTITSRDAEYLPLLVPEICRPDRQQMKFKNVGWQIAPNHGMGVLPTAPVARTRAAIAAGHDELLDRAPEVVNNTGK